MIKKKIHIYGLIDPRNNNIFYIGYTGNLSKRFRTHLNVNGKRREKNLYKDNIIRKILECGLKPEINVLETCDKRFNDELNMYEHERIEIEYIKKYRESGIKLTNLTTGGDGGSTWRRKVYQYSENGEFLKEYESVKEMSELYKVDLSFISKVIDQRRRNSYKSTYLFSSKEKAYKFHFKTTKKYSLPIVQYTLNGGYVDEFKSLVEAFQITNIPVVYISNAINEKIEQAGGFFWFHKNNVPEYVSKYLGKSAKLYKPIFQYDLKGNLIDEFKSIADASRCLKINEALISGNLRNKTKSCKGFSFKYKNKIDDKIKILK